MGNQTSATGDGFNLSSILNDDELQLMDMAMNEGQFYELSDWKRQYYLLSLLLFFTLVVQIHTNAWILNEMGIEMKKCIDIAKCVYILLHITFSSLRWKSYFLFLKSSSGVLREGI